VSNGHYSFAFISELISGNFAVLSGYMTMICASYLGHEIAARRHRKEKWTVGMSVAISLMIISTGMFVTRVGVLWWLYFGLSSPATPTDINMMVGGSFIADIGFLLAIKAIGERLFGRWVWVMAAGTVTLFTIYEFVFR
jgi:hypothetical protein